jgi:adenine phosphoribosyltransferase
MDRIKERIRDIPDFPKKGIIFKDITPLLLDPEAVDAAVEGLVEPFRSETVTSVCAIEARGFIFGALAAHRLGVGFIPIRKPGKLPYDTRSASYELEYGTDTVEIHADAAKAGDRVLMVDDLLATGGTMAASCQLVESLGAAVIGCSFVVELEFLKGREKLTGYPVHSLIRY